MNITFDEVKQLVRDIDDQTNDELTDWECEFLESMLGHSTFSPKQINHIKILHKKYVQ